METELGQFGNLLYRPFLKPLICCLYRKWKFIGIQKTHLKNNECETSVEIVFILLNTSLISLGRAHLHYKMESFCVITLIENIYSGWASSSA